MPSPRSTGGRRTPRGPHAPRVTAPDLPARFDGDADLAPRADLIGVRLRATGDVVSDAHGRIAESRLDEASVTRVDLTGATLVDVAITGVRAAELVCRDGAWRSVEIAGGRIGTLDGLRAAPRRPTLRGLRIDYLSLPSATIVDALVVDCEIGTLDVPEARLDRVRFENTRVDEVDTRGVRADDLDLRGLEAVSFTDVRALSGAWLEPRQAELHAVAFAEALGIGVTG